MSSLNGTVTFSPYNSLPPRRSTSERTSVTLTCASTGDQPTSSRIWKEGRDLPPQPHYEPRIGIVSPRPVKRPRSRVLSKPCKEFRNTSTTILIFQLGNWNWSEDKSIAISMRSQEPCLEIQCKSDSPTGRRRARRKDGARLESRWIASAHLMMQASLSGSQVHSGGSHPGAPKDTPNFDGSSLGVSQWLEAILPAISPNASLMSLS